MSILNQIIETTVGRVLFNEKVPAVAGYINEVLTKKSLRDIIGDILKVTSVPETAAFLEKMLENNWLKKVEFSREIVVTSKGRQ